MCASVSLSGELEKDICNSVLRHYVSYSGHGYEIARIFLFLDNNGRGCMGSKLLV